MEATSTTEAVDQGRRLILTTAALGVAAAGAASLLPLPAIAAAPSDALRPFTVDVSVADLDDLRRRVASTRWPDKETVSDATQGVQLATIQKLAAYWATEYEWSKMQARLDALPQFITDDRRARHPLHPCPLEARQRPAHHRYPWLAGLDHRAIEDHRAAQRPDRPWRQRIGRVPRRDPFATGLRLLGQADRRRVGRRCASPRPGRR